jgi:two-component system, OmpR family, copper resistance phosphate regulon response regulator CusR
MEENRILIVEDEEKIADAIGTGLSEIGYKVKVVYNGRAAWEAFQEGIFDLVVLDIHLPEINGLELCRRIREKNKDIPVIMLTALGALSDKIEGYGHGADDYIIKPFEYQELLAKIRVLLKRKITVKPVKNILRAADLEVVIDTKEVRRGGEYIPLTVKELELLEYLLQHKNRVISRAEISKEVWDIDFDTNTNVVDVYINYLRNKVDKPFNKKLIYTQVGMGYILKDE